MLHLLVQYARDHDLAVEPGFNSKQVRWAIACNTRGQYLHVMELGDVDKRRNPGRTFPRCPDLSQPEMKRGGAGCRHFLVDNAEVVALYGDRPDDPKVLAKHGYFMNLLKMASSAMPALGKIAAILEDSKMMEQIRLALEERRARSTDNMTFAVLDLQPLFPVESEVWYDWWRDFRASLGKGTTKSKKESSKALEEPTMRCLASGERVIPVRTHPKIKGLSDVGGLSMGDALASFKQDAFCSYGLVQSNNSAVSEQMAVSYSVALNHLIKNHGRRLAGAKVVHWYAGKKNIPPEADPINLLESGLAFLGGEVDEEQEEREAQERARQFLESVSTGQRTDFRDYRYYALTLSGASGRLMVRDWMEGRFGDLAVNIAAWFDDLAIVRRDGDGLAPSPKFMAVLGGLVRDLSDLPPPLVSRMWRVAVKNEPIPGHAMAQSLVRMRVDIIQDQPANHARMGLLKAYHLRKGDRSMTPYLNEDHPNPAYHCGRLMAVLADLQRSALGDVGAGVVQRYYAAASTTPALVLGNLTRTSQFHLNKLEAGLAHWYEGRIAAIWGKIKDGVPNTLTLEEQSLFALGYYQQKATRTATAKVPDHSTENAMKEDGNE